MNASRFVAVVAAAGLGVLGAPAEVRLRADSLQWSLRTDTGAAEVLSLRAPGFVRAATVRLSDGRRGQDLALGRPAVVRDTPAPGLSWTPEPALRLDLEAGVAGRCLVWELTCANLGAEPRWLELGPVLTLDVPGEGARWFDGWDDLDLPAAGRSDRMAGNMPLTAVWASGACAAVGLEPSALVSYFRHQTERLPEGLFELSCIVRVVADPGQTEKVRFVLMAPPGDWGKYEAFEAYYDSFPAFFTPHPDVDPRVNLGGAQYRAWPCGPWSPELCRRLFAGWEWCYAPFRRTGDIVGRPEFWDYTPARPLNGDRAGTREEYLARREKAFATGDAQANVAMLFYIPSQVWCEETLAQERYPDALVSDPAVKTYFTTPWVTGHDNERLVFPYGTSFGEQSRKDLAELAGALRLSGFAFDTAGGVARYTGPALPRLQARAWDPDLGVYCSELVAVALLMDYVHTLTRGGRPLAVVANPMATGSYASCFHCDSAMLERSPWQGGRTEADRLRWKMGRKTLVWWEGYEIQDFVDPQTAAPEQVASVYEGLADFAALQSLRLGCIPPPGFTQGVARLARWLPAIVECVRAGWEPVPAVRVPDPAWAARYGRGLGTRLALAHETGRETAVEAIVENARLGQGAFLFAPWDGGSLLQTVSEGATVIPLRLPVRRPVLLRAVLEVRPRGALTEARVSFEQGIRRARLRAVLSGRGRAALALAVPDGMRPAAVACAGRALAVNAQGIECLVEAELGGPCELTAEFASDLFQLEDEELLGYPFAAGGRPACAIEAAPGLAPPAFRLREYFRYWYGRALRPPVEVVLPVVQGPAPSPAVRLRTAGGTPPAVRREGPDLILEAGDEAGLAAAMDRLLRALDRKYWTCDWVAQESIRERLASLPGP